MKSHNSSQESCSQKLSKFVDDLDQTLVRNPRELAEVQKLFDRYFPLHKCNVPEAVDLSKNSKFFREVGHNGDFTVIVFNTHGAAEKPGGFHVQFALSRDGNSARPFAKINL